ncbi:hypothetical protein BJ742DRAFT_374553 [Cladochytrium replicatum]|nr:hypothetical protein BJ742DRAFT_374553 [Cladochytrium replicatum]
MSERADRADNLTFEDGAGGRDAGESIRSDEPDQMLASRPIVSDDSSEIDHFENVDGSESNRTAAQSMPALSTNDSTYSSTAAGPSAYQVPVGGEEIVYAVTPVNGGLPFSFPLDTPPPTPASAFPLTTGNVFTFQTARSAMDSLRAFSEESRQIESQVIPNTVEVAQVTEEQPSFPSMEVTASFQAFLEEVVQPTVVLTQTVEEEVYEDAESFTMDDTRSVDMRSPLFGHDANYFGHENLTRIEEEEGEAVEGEGLGIEDMGDFENVRSGEAMVVEQAAFAGGEDDGVVEATIENVIAPAAEEVIYPLVQPTASLDGTIPNVQFKTVEDEYVTEGSEAWEVEDTRSVLDPLSPDVSAEAESAEGRRTPDFSIEGDDSALKALLTSGLSASSSSVVTGTEIERQVSVQSVTEEVLTVVRTVVLHRTEDDGLSTVEETWEVEGTKSSVEARSPKFEDPAATENLEVDSGEAGAGLAIGFANRNIPLPLKAGVTAPVEAVVATVHEAVGSHEDDVAAPEAEYIEVPPRIERQLSVTAVEEVEEIIVPSVVLVQAEEEEEIVEDEFSWNVDDTKSNDPMSNYASPALRGLPGPAVPEAIEELDEATAEVTEESAEVLPEGAIETATADEPVVFERQLSVQAVEEVTVVPTVVLVTAEEVEEIFDDEVSWNVDDTTSNDPKSNYDSPALQGLPGPTALEPIEVVVPSWEASVEAETVVVESAADNADSPVDVETVVVESAAETREDNSEVMERQLTVHPVEEVALPLEESTEPPALERQLSVQAVEEVTFVPSVVFVTAEEEEDIVDDEVSWNVDDTKSNDPRSKYDSPAIQPVEAVHGLPSDEVVEPLDVSPPEGFVEAPDSTEEAVADRGVESEQVEPEPVIIERQLSVHAVEEVTVMPSVVLLTAEDEELVDDEVSWKVDDTKSNDPRSNMGSPLYSREPPTFEENITPLAEPSEERSSVAERELIEEAALPSSENISSGETFTEAVVVTSEIVSSISTGEPVTIEAEATESIMERDASDVPALVVASTVEEEETVEDEVSWNVDDTKSSEMRSDVEFAVVESSTHEPTSNDHIEIEELPREALEETIPTDKVEPSADVQGVIENAIRATEEVTTAEPALERQLSVQATEEVTVARSVVWVTAEEEQELVDNEVSWKVDDTRSNDPASAIASPARVESDIESADVATIAQPELSEAEEALAEFAVIDETSHEEAVEPTLELQLSVHTVEEEVFVPSVVLVTAQEDTTSDGEVSWNVDDAKSNDPRSNVGSPLLGPESVALEDAAMVHDRLIPTSITEESSSTENAAQFTTLEHQQVPEEQSRSEMSVEAVKETSQQQTVDDNENSNTLERELDGGITRSVEIGPSSGEEHTEHEPDPTLSAAIAEENSPVSTIPEYSKQLLEADEKLQHALNELANVRRLADERGASILDLIIVQQRWQRERQELQQQLEVKESYLRSITEVANKLTVSTVEKEASGSPEVDALRAELEGAKSASALLGEQIAAKAKQLEDAQAELEGVRQDFSERDAEASDFRQQLNELDQIRQDLETALTEVERERDQYGQEVEDLQLQAKLLENSLLVKEDELSEFRVEIKKLTASTTEHEEEVRALKEQLDMVKADLDKEIASHEEIKRANDALISEKTELEATKAILLQTIAEKESQILASNAGATEIETLRTANAALEQSKIDREVSIVKLEETLTGVQNERGMLLSAKEELSTANSELLATASKTQSRSIETDELRVAHETLLTEKDSLAEKLAELEASFATVQTDYSALKEELLTVQNLHQMKEQEVTEIRNRAETLEAAMVNVRAVAEATATATYEGLKEERDALTERAIEAESRAAEIGERAIQDGASAAELEVVKEELKASVELRESLTVRAETAEEQHAEVEAALVNLRDELTRLQEDIKALQELQQTTLSEAFELRERTTTLESAVAEAKNSESAAVGELEALREERDALSQRAIDAEKRLKEINPDAHAAEGTEIASLKEEFGRTVNSRAATVLRAEAADTRVAEADTVAVKLGEEITVLQKELELARSSLKTQEQEAAELRERNGALEIALAEAKLSEANAVASLTQERDALAQKLPKATNVSEEVTRSLVADDTAAIREDFARTAAERDVLAVRVETAEKSFEEANTEVVKLRADFAAMQSELSSIQESREIKEREVAEFGERVAALELALAEAKAAAETYVSSSDAFKAERDALVQAVADTEKRAEDLAARAGVLEAEVAENASSKDQLANAIKELETSKSEVDRLAEAKSRVESEFAVAEKEVVDLKKAVGETTSSLEELKAAHVKETESLKADVYRAASDGETLILSATDSLRARIVELEQQANASSKVLSDKEAELATLNASISEKTAQFETMSSQVQKLKAEIADLEKKVSDGAVAIAEKDSKITELSAVQASEPVTRSIEVPAVPLVDSKVQEQLADAEGRAAQVTQLVQEQLADAEGRAAQVTQLKSENESLKARLAVVEASASSSDSTKSTEISALKVEVEQLKSADAERASAHAKAFEQKDQTISELQKSVQDLKAQFAALKANSSEALLVALGGVDAGSTKSKAAEDSVSEVGQAEPAQARSEDLEKTVAELRETLAEAGKHPRSRSKDGTSTPRHGGSKSRTPTPQPKQLRVINEEADLTSPVGSLGQRLQAELATANQQLQRKQSQILELRKEVEQIMKKETVPFDMRRLFTRLSTLEDRIDIQVYEIANLQFELGSVRSMSRAQEDQIERLRQENATLVQQGVTKRTRAASAATKRNSRAVTSGGDSTSPKSQRNSFTTQDLRDILPSVMYDVLPGDQKVVLIPNSRVRDLSGLTVPGGVSGMASGSGKARDEDDIPNYNLKDVEKMLGESRQKVAEFQKQVSDLELANGLLRRDTQTLRTQVTELQAEAEKRGKTRKFLGGWRLKSQ